jgi:hypothetical protein
MKKLTPPTRDTGRDDLMTSIYTYQSNGEQKGHTLSQADIAAILSIYDAYDANGGQALETLKGANLANSLIETVRNAYSKTYDGDKLHHIRNNLLLHVETCPICGIDAADELDHFLPKAEFKILSIYVRNLIPICNRCNKDKRVLGGPAPATQFAHAYLDEIPETQFLTANVVLQEARLQIQIGVDPAAAISPDLSQRLTYQLNQLNLDVRYRREINIYLGGFAPHWHPLFEIGGSDALSKSLDQQAKYEGTRYHLNDWRALVFQALSGSAEFCEGGFGDAFPVPEHLWVNI